MSVRNFVPTIWAQEALFYLDRSHVWAQPSITNRDYEGEISSYGDRVLINQLGPIEVNEYEPNEDISAPESLTSDQRELVIDTMRYIHFQIDDVDAAQARPELIQQAMARAAYALRQDRDERLAELYATSVPGSHTLGSSGTPVEITRPAQAYEYLIELSTILDDADVPEDARWFIAEPAFVNLLSLDPRFTSGSDGVEVRRNRFAGAAAGFDIYKSNNRESSQGVRSGVAGIPQAASYAEQIPIDSMEAYRPERRFADAVKGLHLSGAKVVEPNGMARLRYELDVDPSNGTASTMDVRLVSTDTTVPVEVTGQPIEVEDTSGGGGGDSADTASAQAATTAEAEDSKPKGKSSGDK